MRSVQLTVSRSVMYTPAFSSAGRPFGKRSSTTRYCGRSALTNGAMNVFRLVTIGDMSSMPSASRDSSTTFAGRGVILSIMLHGKATRLSSSRYAMKSSPTKPFCFQACAISSTALFSFSPLWLQLSMDTSAIGYAPAPKRRSIIAQTILIA